MGPLTKQPRAALLTPLQHMKPHSVARRPKRTLHNETCRRHEALLNLNEGSEETITPLGPTYQPTPKRTSVPKRAMAKASAQTTQLDQHRLDIDSLSKPM